MRRLNLLLPLAIPVALVSSPWEIQARTNGSKALPPYVTTTTRVRAR